MEGKLNIVGVGPGHHDHMTFRAKQVLEESDTIVGYTTYVNLVEDLIQGKEIHSYAMTQEVERAHQCIDLAKEGKIVSLVSSGDPGIYGMAGLIFDWYAPPLAQCAFSPPYIELTVASLNPLTFGFDTVACSIYVFSPLPDFSILNLSGVQNILIFTVPILLGAIVVSLFYALRVHKNAWGIVSLLLLYLAISILVYPNAKIQTEGLQITMSGIVT